MKAKWKENKYEMTLNFEVYQQKKEGTPPYKNIERIKEKYNEEQFWKVEIKNECCWNKGDSG